VDRTKIDHAGQKFAAFEFASYQVVRLQQRLLTIKERSFALCLPVLVATGMTVAGGGYFSGPIAKERTMRKVHLPLAELGLIAGTRVALGVGLGLLVAGRLSLPQRAAAGWALVAIGVLTTIPLAADVLGRRSCPRASEALDERQPGRVLGAG
jgi:hypothetical protein